MIKNLRNIFQATISFLILGFIFLSCTTSPFEAFIISKESRKMRVLNYDNDKDRLDVQGSPFDIGDGANDVTYGPRHRRVYVANGDENTVSVFKIRLISESVFRRRYILRELEKLSTSDQPIAVAVDTRNDLVLVLHRDGTLMRFNGSDLTLNEENNILRELIFSPEAADLTYDARHDLLYVIDQGVDAMLVFDGTTLKPLNFVKTSSIPCSLFFDPFNDRVYVSTRGDDLSQEHPGFSVYKAGPHCSQVKDSVFLDLPYTCPIVTYDDVHNLLYVSRENTRVYDAESFELTDEIHTSLPDSLTSGRIDNKESPLLYLGLAESVRVYDIVARDHHLFFDEISLPGGANRMAVVSPACPEIVSMEPQAGKVGETVTILGLNFGDQKGTSLIEFGGAPIAAEDVINWSDTNIEIKVPEMAKSGAVRVIVGNSSTVLASDQSIGEFEVIPGSIIHVNAREGSNDGDGTEAHPFKTITHALSKARPSDVLYVHWGTYNRVLGERFPLVVGDGVRIEGHGGSSSSFQIKYFSGSSAIQLGNGSSIYNMGIYVDVDSPSGGAWANGIQSSNTSHIENVVVAGFRRGVSLGGEPHNEISASIRGASISNCQTAIRVVGENTNVEIADNHLFENTVAVQLQSNSNRVISNFIHKNIEKGIDIGGKAAFIFSNNISFTNNSSTDQPIGTGIHSANPTHTFINGNEILNNINGIEITVQPEYQYLIRGNLIETNLAIGIITNGSGRCELEQNHIWGNKNFGVFLGNAVSKLQKNSISFGERVGVGVGSQTWLDTILIDNAILDNSYAGVWVSGNPNNIEEGVHVHIGESGIGNSISGSRYGIIIEKAWAYIFNNTFQSNDFGIMAKEQSNIGMGSADNPGLNTFLDCRPGLSNYSHRTVRASGNTWIPSVQGADGQGHYQPGLVVAGPVHGENYSISSTDGRIAF
jgi:hypothetical protein